MCLNSRGLSWDVRGSAIVPGGPGPSDCLCARHGVGVLGFRAAAFQVLLKFSGLLLKLSVPFTGWFQGDPGPL